MVDLELTELSEEAVKLVGQSGFSRNIGRSTAKPELTLESWSFRYWKFCLRGEPSSDGLFDVELDKSSQQISRRITF